MIVMSAMRLSIEPPVLLLVKLLDYPVVPPPKQAKRRGRQLRDSRIKTNPTLRVPAAESLITSFALPATNTFGIAIT